jgi:uncharacterized membrane protein
MGRILVVVFDSESKAYQGSRALAQLDAARSITIHAESVIKKNDDGTVTVKQPKADLPVRRVGGTALESLVGLLGGSVDMDVGAAAGRLAGAIRDLHVAGVNAEFLDQVTDALAPGKCAVLADISEEWATPVDTRMEPLGGAVLRPLRKSLEDEQRAMDVAVHRAEISELQCEYARARADRRAKIRAAIDELSAKLLGKIEETKPRSAHIRSEAEAKIKSLQKKATLEARVTQVWKDCEQTEASEATCPPNN